MKFGAAILAGGESRRMGRDKAKLEFGGRSFVELLAQRLSGFEEVLLSVARPRGNTLGLKEICDPYAGRGPLSGLCAALEECQSEALLFVPCDAPLFTLEAGQYLCSLLTEEYDGVVAVSSEGGEHPLCAVYRKSAAAAFRSTLESGENRVYKAFSRLNLRFARLEDAGIGDEVLMNVNSPEDYEELKRLRAK